MLAYLRHVMTSAPKCAAALGAVRSRVVNSNRWLLLKTWSFFHSIKRFFNFSLFSVSSVPSYACRSLPLTSSPRAFGIACTWR
jgi:hypothetical protein